MNKSGIALLLMVFVVAIVFVAVYTTQPTHHMHIHKKSTVVKTNKRIPHYENLKINRVATKYKGYIFGVDFSHYQGRVNWHQIENMHPGVTVSFVILRATMGGSGRDAYYQYNIKQARKHKFVVGAYHYYRPNENSVKQANNFISRVKLKSGDLPPVLDIEKTPTTQSLRSMQIGLKKWLTIVENHFGVKPIIYTSDKFYSSYLRINDFKDYPLWIANYNNHVSSPQTANWTIWQFSQKGILDGVYEHVDYNVFKGDTTEFRKILIK